MQHEKHSPNTERPSPVQQKTDALSKAAVPVYKSQVSSMPDTPLQSRPAVPVDKGNHAVQKRANHTGLPDNLKNGVETMSGMSMDDVKVHYNSDKPAQLQALAYAQGTDIHVGPGQEKHLPHEAWHVVQQKQGRVQPSIQMQQGINVNDDTGLEQEATIMGNQAMSINSAAPHPGMVRTVNNSQSSSPLQLLRSEAIDPLSAGEAVGQRQSLGTSQRCAGVGRVKINDTWTPMYASSSSGTTGPQGHVERNILDHFVNGIRVPGTDKSPYGKYLNTTQGTEAGKKLKDAGVTDVEVYTELPPCWGCDPWFAELDKQLSGEVIGRYSYLLTNYYNDNGKLRALNFDRFDGTGILFNYHIYYVLGQTDRMNGAYNSLISQGYTPPAAPGTTGFSDKVDDLESVVFQHYESAKLKGMEIGNNDFYTSRFDAILQKIRRTSPAAIILSFGSIREQVSKATAAELQWINKHYNEFDTKMEAVEY